MTKDQSIAYEKFKKYVAQWIPVLGLSDWDINVRLPNKNDNQEFLSGTESIVFYDRQACSATILFQPEWPDHWKQTNTALEATALHELLHLVLAPLVAITSARFNISKEGIDYEEHRIINKLLDITL